MLSSRSDKKASEILILSAGLEHISIFNAFMMSYAKHGAFSPISYKLDDINLSIKSSKYHASHNN